MTLRLLMATGLAREARLAALPGTSTVCSGGDSARLASLLAVLDPTQFWGVMSFGISGGLDPEMEPGDLVMATAVDDDGEKLEVSEKLNEHWRRSLFSHDLRVKEGVVAGVGAPVFTPDEKAALRAKTCAVAVDMESHVAARWAAAHGLPFSVMRAVSDPAYRSLPALAAKALKPDGNVAISQVLLGLARSPRQIGALAAAGRDANAAFNALKAAVFCLH